MLPIVPKKISKRVRLHHDFHVMNQWRLLWHLNLHLNSRFFLAKREEGVWKNPSNHRDFPEKKLPCWISPSESFFVSGGILDLSRISATTGGATQQNQKKTNIVDIKIQKAPNHAQSGAQNVPNKPKRHNDSPAPSCQSKKNKK